MCESQHDRIQSFVSSRSPLNVVTRFSSHVYTEYEFRIVLNETWDRVTVFKAATRNRNEDTNQTVFTKKTIGIVLS